MPLRTRPFARCHVPMTATFPALPRRSGVPIQRAYPHLHCHVSVAHGEEAAHDSGAGAASKPSKSVRFARNLVADIEFSPEDGYRSEPDFLCRVLGGGASPRVQPPSTCPIRWATLFPSCTATSSKPCVSACPIATRPFGRVHCHNDLGMAVANSLAGVKIGGARQVECTINGLGRARWQLLVGRSGHGDQNPS